MTLGVLTIHIYLPGCSSLKEKRGRLKPLLARLHREFNISVAEIDHHDTWQNSVVACACISNDHKHTQRVLQKVLSWIENNHFDVDVTDDRIEMF